MLKMALIAGRNGRPGFCRWHLDSIYNGSPAPC
jgi:hypothetical protein